MNAFNLYTKAPFNFASLPHTTIILKVGVSHFILIEVCNLSPQYQSPQPSHRTAWGNDFDIDPLPRKTSN